MDKNNIRLIDANAMRDDWLENGENEYIYDTNAVLESIDSQPTIDAVPVVRCRECWKRGNERECPMCHEEFDGCDYCTIDYTSDDGCCHMGKKVAKDMDVPTKDGGAESV